MFRKVAAIAGYGENMATQQGVIFTPESALMN